jgi:hypothetical protein
MNFMFNLEDYETVEERLIKYWKDHPDGQIHTKVLEHTSSRFIVEASIYRTEADARPWTTGLAEETIQGRGVNATSALENCETSAIGRALANAGYATKGKRASREEMSKVAAKEAVTQQVQQIKAKMQETAKEYVPVPVEEDPWSQSFAAPVTTMEEAVATVKSVLGGTTDKDIQRCPHGDMVWKTGKTKAGKQWGHFRCMGHILGEAERCEPIWYEIKPDGTWGKQEKIG